MITERNINLNRSRALSVEWQDFDWEKKLVHVLNKPKFDHTVKNRQVRVVPISDELRDKLLPYIKEEGLCFPVPATGAKHSEEGPKQTLKRILTKAGFGEEKRSS